MDIGIFDFLPIWNLYIGMALSLLLSFEIGYQLAFVLAFTFAMASSQHNLRKLSVLEEANIIGTTYLRADLIGERDETKVKQLLQEYVDGRVYAIQMGMDKVIMKRALARSVEIQEQLWAQVSSAAKKEPNLNTGLLVQSVNSLIDIHQKRVTAGLYNRIPSSIWLVLLAIAVFTMMTMGSQARLSKSRRLTAVIPLIMAFTALTAVVLDLDRPQEGMITVGQEAMIDLQSSLNRESK